MFARILNRARPEESRAIEIYSAIVAQARQPALYETHRVPDTVDGRFEMIVLHLVLLFHRFGPDHAASKGLTQEVFDTFLADMDQSLREMGVGDLGVPKRMKAMGQAFYGRLTTYGKLLADGDQGELAEALDRNLFPAGPATPATGLAAYAFAAREALGAQPVTAIAEGRLEFPDPATFAHEVVQA